MRQLFKKGFLLFLFSGFFLLSFSQSKNKQASVERQLISVIDLWMQSTSDGNYAALRQLLADDFYLFQNGRRYTKEEAMGWIREVPASDVIYNLKNIKSGSGGDLAYLSFDIEVYNKTGNAGGRKSMEMYIFKKINSQWAIQAKSVVPADNSKNRNIL
jgi:hypothetical protein